MERVLEKKSPHHCELYFFFDLSNISPAFGTIPAHKDIYLTCDNYSTHKHERVQRWLAAHKRFHVRFTPTSASWLTMVERFFRDITHSRLRRGVFQDLEQLITANGNYIECPQSESHWHESHLTPRLLSSYYLFVPSRTKLLGICARTQWKLTQRHDAFEPAR